MREMMNEFLESVGTYLPSLIGAIAVLIIGWIVAMIVSGIVRGVLRKLSFNRRMSRWTGAEGQSDAPDLENGIAKGMYFLIMLFVLVAFFQTLRITLITEPLNSLLNQVFAFVPQIMGAGVLLVSAWIVAKLLQVISLRLLTAAKIDERFAGSMRHEEEGTEKPVALAKSVADAVYGLVFLLFLPAILGALSLEGLLAPIQAMVNKVLAFLPNLVTAGIILFIGWFAARLVQQIVTNFLIALGVDKFSERAGMANVMGSLKLSSMMGMILYAFMLIPVVIASLNTLQLESITAPASNMLSMILAALPNIFAAAVVIVISYAIGRLVAGLVTNLLSGIGFDAVTKRIGLTKETPEGTWAPSKAIGHVVLVAIVFFSILEASRLLGFEAFSNLISLFMVFAGHILLGLGIFAIGMAVANLVAKGVKASGIQKASMFATTARVAILTFAGAMALREMGLANEIISLAFGLVLGAVALGTAIAFGLGARDIAAREMDQWLQTMRSKAE